MTVLRIYTLNFLKLLQHKQEIILKNKNMKTINKLSKRQTKCTEYIFSAISILVATVILKGKRLLLTTILFLFSVFTFAVTNTMTAGTTWEGGTWSLSHVPLSTEDVIINSDLILTINSAAVCNSLELLGDGNNSSVTINGASCSLTVGGAITINRITHINKSNILAVDGGTLSAASINLTSDGDNSKITELSIGTGTATITGNITASGSASWLVFTAAGGILNLGGNITGLAKFTCGTGNVNLNGSTAQTVGVYTYNNLTVNNSSGITLGGPVTVTNQLTMTAGNINLAGYKLTLGTAPGTPGTLSHSGVASNGWLYGGSFMRYFNTTAIADRNVAGMFPMGSSTDFRPFYVSYPLSTLTSGGTLTLSHTSATTVTNISFADGISTIVRRDDSYWTASTDAGINVAGTPFNLSAEGTGFGSVSNVSDLRLTLAGSVIGTDGTHAGTLTDPQINRTGLTLANLTNNFYPASVNISSPLPIELLSFDAVCNGDKVNMNWATASETNNDYFSVEKSHDGLAFENIGNIPGAGNSNSMLNYSYTDAEPYNNISYYRIKQTDFNGKFSYSTIVKVDFVHQLAVDVNIYPNPFNMQATIIINDASQMNNYELKIYNNLGKEVMNTNVTKQSTSLETCNLPAGVYFYKVINNDKTIQSGKLISQQ
jgi:hypothetical protein